MRQTKIKMFITGGEEYNPLKPQDSAVTVHLQPHCGGLVGNFLGESHTVL